MCVPVDLIIVDAEAFLKTPVVTCAGLRMGYYDLTDLKAYKSVCQVI